MGRKSKNKKIKIEKPIQVQAAESKVKEKAPEGKIKVPAQVAEAMNKEIKKIGQTDTQVEQYVTGNVVKTRQIKSPRKTSGKQK